MLLSIRWGLSGIYLIGCGGEVVYVGQSVDLRKRVINSLGTHYHQVRDTALPWSVAFAPCDREDMDELESTAIRTYAPRFNTSLPSLAKSQLRLPAITGVAAVFRDQDRPCGAFLPENLKRQTEAATLNPEPPWKTKKTRRTSAPRTTAGTATTWQPVAWTKEDSDELVRAYGVSLKEPLRFKVNLGDEGSVITRDGEYIGTWQMDENEHPSFYPTGASEAKFFSVFVGSLCRTIADWHEAETGEVIG